MATPTLLLIYPLGVTTLVYYAIYFAVTSAISFGISYLLSQLNKPKLPAAPDNQPTLSTRGSYLTLVLGRRRVAPVVCWLGGRELKKHSDKQYFKEKGMHAICLGPVDKLIAIYEGGKRVTHLIGEIHRDTSPSGSQFTIDNFGTFRIYWGEDDQPIDPMLYEQTGCGSMWPGVCWIAYDNKAVGFGWQWSQLEYVVERRIDTEAVLTDSSPYLDRTTRAFRGSVEDSGINPAHAIWYFLTRPAPYGLEIPAAYLDGGAFEELGTLVEDEHVPVNILARDGVTGSSVLNDLMHEVGFFLPQVANVLLPIVVRPPSGTVVEVTVDAQLDPQPEIKQQHGDTVPTYTTYIIYDENAGYKPTDIGIPNDAQARQRGGVQPKNVTLSTITDRITGLEVAQRLSHDDAVDGQAYTLSLVRGARELWPGQLFTVPNFGILRVVSKQPAFMSTETTIEAVYEQYGFRITEGYYPNGIGNPRTDDDLPLDIDPFVRLFLLPADLNTSTTPSIWVLRIRANPGIISAEVFMSGNGVSYGYVNRDEPHVCGGTINRPILFDEPTHDGGVITSNVTFTPYNTDTDEVADLGGNDEEWLAGDQIAVIEDEVFLVQRIAPVPGGWRLDGFKRAMYGTTAVTHPAGAQIFIFKISERTLYTRHLVQSGATVYVKTLPYNSRGEVALADAAASSLAIP